MFKRVQLRLTLMCGGITTLILIIMTLGYLYISEKNLKDTQFLSFQNTINTITANLEQQSVITHEWLAKLEGNGTYQIYLLDNDVPFLFNSRSDQAGTNTLFTEAFTYYQNNFATETPTPNHSTHLEFPLTSLSGMEYYCSVITQQKEKKVLQMIILSPLAPMNEQLMQQRYLFLGIILSVLIIIWIFSLLFTRKLLSPIEKNRKDQLQFVASASHELRTPLAVILSCLESYRKAPPDKKDNFLNMIESEGKRMSTLVDDMLTLSLSDNHTFSIEKNKIDLDTLLLNSYEIFGSMAKENHLHFSIHLPTTPLPHCNCDKDRISQVVAILLHNAISYTPDGGTVHLSLEQKRNHFLFTVSDTGIGISDEEKAKIFYRFYRSEKSRSAKAHFGLGLCIASEIVLAHNGSIKVSDTPNGGATFTVCLPVQ